MSQENEGNSYFDALGISNKQTAVSSSEGKT